MDNVPKRITEEDLDLTLNPNDLIKEIRQKEFFPGAQREEFFPGAQREEVTTEATKLVQEAIYRGEITLDVTKDKGLFNEYEKHKTCSPYLRVITVKSLDYQICWTLSRNIIHKAALDKDILIYSAQEIPTGKRNFTIIIDKKYGEFRLKYNLSRIPAIPRKRKLEPNPKDKDMQEDINYVMDKYKRLEEDLEKERKYNDRVEMRIQKLEDKIEDLEKEAKYNEEKIKALVLLFTKMEDKLKDNSKKQINNLDDIIELQKAINRLFARQTMQDSSISKLENTIKDILKREVETHQFINQMKIVFSIK
jgi:hypothetical protein